MRLDKRISFFIEKWVRMDGEKLDFNAYDAFRLPYEADERKMLLTAGRQVGKTVYLASKLAAKSVVRAPNRALYVAPLEAQTKSFSKTKFQVVIDNTPEIKATYTGKESQNDVFFKKNVLGSYTELTYASVTGMDPVRVRGKSADDLYIDEAQDIDYDILPAIEEVTTSSKDPIVTYAGTAKSLENTTGVIWENSTKMERMIYCHACRKWNILDRRNISKEGLVCNNMSCRKRIHTSDAKWMMTGDRTANYVAFRIPQVALPFHNEEKKWAAVWNKYQTYAPESFNQEVLGIPSGAADRFLTMDMLKKLCVGGKMVHTPSKEWMNGYHSFFMGIDWTGDGVLIKSRTAAVVIGHRKDGKFEMVWGQIFPPGSANQQAEELTKVARLFQCKVVGADAGMGMIQNADMMQALGMNRFRQIMYVAGSKGFDFDFERNMIKLHKTQAIDTIMSMLTGRFRPQNLTRGKVLEFIFPEFDDSRMFLEDILAEFEQENKLGTKMWTHSSIKPDDTLHAIVFAMYAYMHHKAMVTFY
jgi:hypothetical protein